MHVFFSILRATVAAFRKTGLNPRGSFTNETTGTLNRPPLSESKKGHGKLDCGERYTTVSWSTVVVV